MIGCPLRRRHDLLLQVFRQGIEDLHVCIADRKKRGLIDARRHTALFNDLGHRVNVGNVGVFLTIALRLGGGDHRPLPEDVFQLEPAQLFLSEVTAPPGGQISP